MHTFLFKCVLVYTFQIVLGDHPKTILLSDGNRMPQIAFGTATKVSELKDVTRAVIYAIESGYRHFDTAPLNFNEEQIGEAIMNVTKRGIVTRNDLFITSKLDSYSDRSTIIPAIRGSLKRLRLNYVDLYLIHTPKYVIERGLLLIPKSTNQKRLAQNIDLLNFSLTSDEVASMSRFNVRVIDFAHLKGYPNFPF